MIKAHYPASMGKATFMLNLKLKTRNIAIGIFQSSWSFYKYSAYSSRSQPTGNDIRTVKHGEVGQVQTSEAPMPVAQFAATSIIRHSFLQNLDADIKEKALEGLRSKDQN